MAHKKGLGSSRNGRDSNAQRLGVKPRTLRCWREACHAETPLPLRGRPLAQAEPAQRQIVTSWLDQVGPGVGVPTLRLQFPGLARAALADGQVRWMADGIRRRSPAQRPAHF